MSTFTPNELTYLSEQRIGRLATADRVRELPAAHRLLDDKTVEVSVIKRRRGTALVRPGCRGDRPARPPAHPGGLYLLGARTKAAIRTTADGHRSACPEPGSAWDMARCCRPVAGSGLA